jgi:hypothetical protein
MTPVSKNESFALRTPTVRQHDKVSIELKQDRRNGVGSPLCGLRIDQRLEGRWAAH